MVSLTVGTRTMIPWVLLAGTLTLKVPSKLTKTLVKLLPPSTLTCTGVVVSVPTVAVPLLRVKATVVAVADGLLSATLKSRVSPSVMVSPVTITVGALSLSVMTVVTLC